MNTDPLVSIIIPIYNRADLIGETLQSVKNQTYQNWECIIIDDFSIDNTMDIIKRFVNGDSRFIVSKNIKTKGAPGARNTGVEISMGSFLIFLDSDDLLDPNCLSNRINEFKKNSHCDFLVFSTVEFKNTIDDTNILVNVNTTQDTIARFLMMDVPWVIMSPIWKKESFLKIGQWKEEVLSWQDWDIHLRALLKNFKYLYYSNVDNYWRINSDTYSINNSSEDFGHLQSQLRLIESLKTEIKNNPIYLAKLNRLIFWIGEKALKMGWKEIAREALELSHHNLNPMKKIINYIGINVFSKYIIKLNNLPDSGNMSKVLYRNIKQ